MKTIDLTLFAICCFLPSFTYGQDLLLRHFTPKDGLPSNTIYNAFQDSRGYMWFCTDQGISRFDGCTFANFTTKHGLPDNEVFALKEDIHNRTWISSYNAKISFIHNDRIFNADNSNICKYAEQDPILLSIKRNADKMPPHISLSGFLDVAEKLVTYSYYNADECIHLYRDHGADYFFIHGYVCSVKNGKVTTLFSGCMRAYYHKGTLYLCFAKKDGVSIAKAIDHGSTMTLSGNVHLPVTTVYQLALLNDSTLMLATDKGVLSYTFTTNDIRTFILKNTPVTTIRKDDENNVWFTTLNNGVFFLPAVRPILYTNSNNRAEAVAVLLSNGFVGGYKNGNISVMNGHRRFNFRLPGVTMKDRILKITEVSGNKLFIGTDNGVYKADMTTGAIERLRDNLLTHAIKDIYKRTNKIYVSCVHGACVTDTLGSVVQQFWRERTTAIAASNGTVWLGTLQGVFKWEPNTGPEKLKADTQLSMSRITDIEIANNGDVLFLTHHSGIFIWNGKSIQHIDERTELSSNICKKALISHDNGIWVLTSQGLDRLLYQGSKYVVQHFPLANGLVENDISDFAVVEDKLYICVGDGIVEQTITQNTVAQSIRTYITSVVLKDTILVNVKSLILSHDQGDLTINYAAIALADGHSIVYKYILEGGKFDTTVTKLSSVNISAIGPGNYVFKVWAMGSNGTWSKVPAVFLFTVEPPFWQKGWFLFSTLCATVAVLYILVRWRITTIRRAERNKTALNKKMANLEMQALRAQINPHFIFNALNAIQSYYSLNDERNANRYMTMFANLIRQILAHSKDNWIRLSEEINMIRSYIELEKMRFKSTFEYEIIVSQSLDIQSIKVPSMMIQPFVENAINHGLRHLKGRPGKLIVNFSPVKEGILCSIEDDGVGFKQAETIENKSGVHKSLGMDITNGRIDTMNLLYNTSFVIKVIHKNAINSCDTGAIIEISLPTIKTISDE